VIISQITAQQKTALPSLCLLCYLRLAEVKENIGGDLNVGKIMMDYEKGLNNAFNIIFENVNIVGCDFHWKNCLLKRLSHDGLLELYSRDLRVPPSQQVHLCPLLCAPREGGCLLVESHWRKDQSWEEYNT